MFGTDQVEKWLRVAFGSSVMLPRMRLGCCVYIANPSPDAAIAHVINLLLHSKFCEFPSTFVRRVDGLCHQCRSIKVGSRPEDQIWIPEDATSNRISRCTVRSTVIKIGRTMATSSPNSEANAPVHSSVHVHTHESAALQSPLEVQSPPSNGKAPPSSVLDVLISWCALPLRVQWAVLAWWLVMMVSYWPSQSGVWTRALAISAVVGTILNFNQYVSPCLVTRADLGYADQRLFSLIHLRLCVCRVSFLSVFCYSAETQDVTHTWISPGGRTFGDTNSLSCGSYPYGIHGVKALCDLFTCRLNLRRSLAFRCIRGAGSCCSPGPFFPRRLH